MSTKTALPPMPLDLEIPEEYQGLSIPFAFSRALGGYVTPSSVGIIGLGENFYTPERTIDDTLGGYAYLNIADVAPTAPHGKVTVRAGIKGRPPLPASIIPVQYARDTTLGHREIISPQFQRRERLAPVKNVEDLIDLFARANRRDSHRKDTWVIINGIALRLDKLFARVGKDAPRTLDNKAANDDFRKGHNLPYDFMLPENGAYDRFARILHHDRHGIFHPVLLHFTIADEPKRGGSLTEPVRTVRLTDYFIEKANPTRVQLPVERVEVSVRVKDYKAFDKLKVGGSYVAIAHPFHGAYGDAHRTLTQGFNVFRDCDIVAMTREELAARITPKNTAPKSP